MPSGSSVAAKWPLTCDWSHQTHTHQRCQRPVSALSCPLTSIAQRRPQRPRGKLRHCMRTTATQARPSTLQALQQHPAAPIRGGFACSLLTAASVWAAMHSVPPQASAPAMALRQHHQPPHPTCSTNSCKQPHSIQHPPTTFLPPPPKPSAVSLRAPRMRAPGHPTSNTHTPHTCPLRNAAHTHAPGMRAPAAPASSTPGSSGWTRQQRPGATPLCPFQTHRTPLRLPRQARRALGLVERGWMKGGGDGSRQ